MRGGDSGDEMADGMGGMDTDDILDKAVKLTCDVVRQEYVDGAGDSPQSQWAEDEDE